MSETRSLFAELGRRHVFRVAIAYAVTAWLLLQLAAIVLPTFGAPHWVLKVLIGVFVLFFPVAILLAWAFEMTPEGVRRTVAAEADESQPARRRIGRVLNAGIIAVLAAAVGVLAWRQFGASPKQPSARVAVAAAASATAPVTTAEPAPATVVPAKSIAVLPFENLSPDKDNAYFAAGMQDMILTKLADVGDLKVISRTSTERFSSHPDDLEAIGRELGVATILEGSVQKAGDRVLINVQLIDAATDTHIWAKAYTRTLKNVFGVEGDVAQKVAVALQARLTAQERRRIAAVPTGNSAAYDAYLRGMAAWGFDYASMQKAAAAFRKAVKLDPGFGLAWGRLATADEQLYYAHLGSRARELATIRRALHRALALSPKTAVSQAALGGYRLAVLGDYPAALDAFQRAAQLAPSDPDTLEGVAYVDEVLGRWEQALAAARRAVALDPLNRRKLIDTANAFMDARDFATARRLANRALALNPHDRDALAVEAATEQAEGRFARAGSVLASLGSPGPADIVFPLALQQKFLTRDDTGAVHMLQRGLADSARLPAEWRPTWQVELGFALRLAGRPAAARSAYEKARSALKRLLARDTSRHDVARLADYWRLGLAEAGLGHAAAALAAVREAMALAHATHNEMFGVAAEEKLARIEARIGEPGKAIAHLRHLLTIPYRRLVYGAPITLPLLRADPHWNPLRKDPRFQALLRHRPAGSASAPP